MFSGSASAVALAVTALAATASNAAAAEPIQPVRACASLGTPDLAAVNARVESAAEPTTDGVAFCEVKGYISPQTHYTVLLPLQTWRGSYLQQSCSGFCGYNNVSLTDAARTSGHRAPFAPISSGELVVAADDQGHAHVTPRRDSYPRGSQSTPYWSWRTVQCWRRFRGGLHPERREMSRSA